MRTTYLAVLFTGTLLAGAASAQDDGVYTNPAKAGILAAIQGEYMPARNTQIKAGAQVVALGKDEFLVTFLPGGLPGAGWDGQNRYTATGTLENARLTIKGSRRVKWSGEIYGGKLTAKDDKGSLVNLVKTQRISPTLNARPPANSAILFNGRSTTGWSENVSLGEANGLILSSGKKKVDAVHEQTFTDFTLHLEFRLPLIPLARKTKRAEGGIYLQGRYEIQLLDTFGVAPDKTTCGAILYHHAPKEDAALPPLEWQTLDVDFTAAKWDEAGKKKLSKARATVKLNGRVILDDVEIPASTRGGMKETSDPGPLRIQDGGFPILYRNIWVAEK